MLPGLDKFSATLESVPPVGIVGSEVRYVQQVLGSKNSIINAWRTLDKLPATAKSGETTCLFSYNGILYVSIGKTIYSKSSRNTGDPELRKAATDNWAYIFNAGWTNCGACLPESDFRSLVPFNEASSDGKTLSSWLVKIADDFTISYSTGSVKASMSFTKMAFNGKGTAPKLQKAAYWNNSIWGYDSSNTLYEITPNFAGSSYVVKSSSASTDAVLDMTAIDTGIIVTRKDKKLWKRIVSAPANPEDKNSKATTSWKAWIDQDSVTCLGAAAPGVLLNTKTLATYLRSNYIDTQTKLIPVINQILAFCASHDVYLNRLAEEAKKYGDEGSAAEKKVLAKKDGKIALKHAQIFGKLLSKTLKDANTTIVGMTRQTSSINASIKTQLAEISIALTALNATLKAQERVVDTLTTELWASIAATVIGVYSPSSIGSTVL